MKIRVSTWSFLSVVHPPNIYSYVQEENLDSTRILFRKSKKVLNIFDKWSCLYGCRSIQSKKEIHSNRKFGSHCFCKMKKPNKNFLKLKCDWWCVYFDMTDSYLRFILTDRQMTVPFFLVVIFPVIVGVHILTRQTIIWDLFQPTIRQLYLFFTRRDFFQS